jgi:hypothetical protein
MSLEEDNLPISERHIHVAFYNRKRDSVRRIRHYKYFDSAAKRAVQIVMTEGKVGEVCEIYHALTGMQYGTVKLSAKGQIMVEYIQWVKFES